LVNSMNPARLQNEDRHTRKNNHIKKLIKRNRRIRIIAKKNKEVMKEIEKKFVFNDID